MSSVNISWPKDRRLPKNSFGEILPRHTALSSAIQVSRTRRAPDRSESRLPVQSSRSRPSRILAPLSPIRRSSGFHAEKQLPDEVVLGKEFYIVLKSCLSVLISLKIDI